MWIIFNLRSEFKKIKDIFKKTKNNISNNSKEIKDLKQENIIIKRDLRVIENLGNQLLMKLSEPNPEPKSELHSEPIKEKHFDKVMVKKAVKNRPELIKTAIRGFLERGLTTTQIFNVIVTEKQLVGKTQFYHYLSLVRNELRTELRPELRTK